MPRTTSRVVVTAHKSSEDRCDIVGRILLPLTSIDIVERPDLCVEQRESWNGVERNAQCIELGRKIIPVHAYETRALQRALQLGVGEGAGHAVAGCAGSR